jgi:hypothetical protein
MRALEENSEPKLKENENDASGNCKQVVVDNKPEENDKKSSDQNPSFFHILKEHLTCEMYDAILIVCETPHLILKIFLGLFLLIAHGFAAYTTIELILTYLKYDVITTSRTIYETPSVFPKVTVCNLNTFATQTSLNIINKFYTLSSNLSYYDKSSNGISAQLLIMSLVSESNDTFKKAISHSFDDVLIGCKFNYQQCYSSDFKWEFDQTYGNCYSFNSGFNSTGQKTDLKKSSLAGNVYGLQLDLYVDFYENLTFFNSVLGGKGVIVRIDNASYVVDHLADGISVSVGSITNIALRREKHFAIKSPYSDCVLDNDVTNVFDSYIYKAIIASGFTYSQQFCLIQCAQKLVIDTCGCYLTYLTKIFDATKCTNATSISCAQNAYWNVYSSNDYMNKQCLPLCPLECNSTRFTYTLSMSKLLGDPYVDILKNTPSLASDFVTQAIDAERASSSIVKVNIFYDSLSYMKSEETPALDIVTLVAYMGGNWGLFLSLNFFSIAEIITTLIEIYFYRKSIKKINKV